MPSNPGDQKRRAKKNRKAAERQHARRAPSRDVNPAAILREAAALPMGPSFISADWLVEDPPRLVTLLFTRRSPVGIVVPTIVLVDRTCLGVKNAFIAEPLPGHRMPALLEQLGMAHEGGMKPCDVLVAQSVVFHAIDYAKSLGFAPHRDFPEILVGPRPEALVDTLHARPAQPFYVSGPDDSVDAVLAQLEAKVGAGGFRFVRGDA